MGHIVRETRIGAPRKRVFDLARHVEAHVATMPEERAEGASGLLELGDSVTFKQRQFGVPFALTAEVTEMDRPRRFADEQLSGVFGSLVHEHTFEGAGDETVMRDSVRFTLPFGPVGRLGESVARRRLLALVDYHAEALRELAEGDNWRRFLGADY